MVVHSPRNMNGMQTNAQPFNKLFIIILIGFSIEARLVLSDIKKNDFYVFTRISGPYRPSMLALAEDYFALLIGCLATLKLPQLLQN